MLFDTISAIELALSAAIIVAVASFNLSHALDGRLRAVIAFAGWFVVVVILGASEALSPEHFGGPGLGLAVAIPVVALSAHALAGSREKAINRRSLLMVT